MNKHEVIDGFAEYKLEPENYSGNHSISAYIALSSLARLYDPEHNSHTTSPGNGADSYRLNSWVKTMNSRYGNALALPSACEVHHKDQIKPIFYTIDRQERQVINQKRIVLPTESSLIGDKELTVYSSNTLYDCFEHDELQTMICLLQKAEKGLNGEQMPIDYDVNIAMALSEIDTLATTFPTMHENSADSLAIVEKSNENWSEFEDLATERFMLKNANKTGVNDTSFIYELGGDQTYAIKLTGTANGVVMAEILMLNGSIFESQNYIFTKSMPDDSQIENLDHEQRWNFDELYETLNLGTTISNEEFTSFYSEALSTQNAHDARQFLGSQLL